MRLTVELCALLEEREREVGGPEIAAAHRDEKVDGPRPNSFRRLCCCIYAITLQASDKNKSVLNLIHWLSIRRSRSRSSGACSLRSISAARA